MFDGVPEQFHQFIAPRTTSSLPLHLLSFPNNSSNAFPPAPTTTTPFDPYNNHLPLLHHQPNLLHSPPPPPTLNLNHKDSITNFNQRQPSQSQLPDLIHSCTWTHDEVVALFRIRSTMDTTWFPDLTWEHVSRKLAEVGFKRSPEKCKEKFEEESRYLSNINYNVDNYRFLSELEQEFYQAHHQNNPEAEAEAEKPREGQEADQKTTSSGQAMEEAAYSRHESSRKSSKERERKRKKEEDDEFEILKGFCENIVNKMMAQQEEMHNKLLEDMMKRDEEKFAREEAWKKREIERMNKELEMMAQEQAVAGDRQATVIEFLKKFTPTSKPNTCSPSPPTIILQNQNPKNNNGMDERSPPTLVEVGQNPSSVSTCTWSSSSGKGDDKDSVGRRWPRDEVLALINLRCSVNNSNVVNGNASGDPDGNNKTPLWERISQGMSELGYKRSAKRCKEKWENINKYFRKTKDINKKRSLDSRTCPYFHQLTTLYTQGNLIASQSQTPHHAHLKTTTMHQPLDTHHHI